jgi:hypothetical protein
MNRAVEARLEEAEEGIGHLRDELDAWVERSAAYGHAGAHTTRLEALRRILDHALVAVREDFVRRTGESVSDAYAAAAVLDRRVLFCRRLLRWYVLRFGQRTEPGVRECLLGADEVVWSVWARIFEVARADRPPAPLCFVDDDPVPWASFHDALPGEARPPSRDSLLSERVRALPVPVIGLPPIVVRRPWWLVTAVHETGHHVQHAFAVVDAVQIRLREAALAAGAHPAEAKQWADWGREVFADAFAAVCVGAAAMWAIVELERVESDWTAPRATYPPAAVRVALTAAVVAETGAPAPTSPADAAPAAVAGLLDRVPAIAAALLDIPLGAGSLRTLGEGGAERAYSHVRWAARLAAGDAHPLARIGAAEACIAGAVLAWDDPHINAQRPAAAELRTSVLRVLPGCRPDGSRAGRAEDDTSAGAELARSLIEDGVE